ncbi:MAG TPA: FG-GAP-like repeat-containing protein [Polyangiaceae bacterium]|nr:FG-GAP-like repeat-containing protein [Polyangiaceae bacterium]
MASPSPRFSSLPLRRLTAAADAGACAAVLAPGAARAAFFRNPVNLSNDNLWTNYLVAADLDGDGDLDVVVPNAGGFVTPSPSPQALQVFLNDGQDAFTAGTAQTLGAAFTKAVRQVALGDIDGDGDLDLSVPDAAAQAADKLFVRVAPKLTHPVMLDIFRGTS